VDFHGFVVWLGVSMLREDPVFLRYAGAKKASIPALRGD